MAGGIFTVVKVRELGENDFYIGSRTPTLMKFSGCALVLFYIPSDPVSQATQTLWAQLAATLAAPYFMAVNCSLQSEILAAFKETGDDPDHPLSPFRVDGIPQIITFRKGWPQAYYNGELSYDALQNFALTLACQPGYYEPTSDFIGVGRTLLDDQGEYDLVVPDSRFPGATAPSSSRSYYVPPAPVPEQPVTASEEEIYVDEDGNPLVLEEGEEVVVESTPAGGVPPGGEVTTVFVEDQV